MSLKTDENGQNNDKKKNKKTEERNQKAKTENKTQEILNMHLYNIQRKSIEKIIRQFNIVSKIKEEDFADLQEQDSNYYNNKMIKAMKELYQNKNGFSSQFEYISNCNDEKIEKSVDFVLHNLEMTYTHKEYYYVDDQFDNIMAIQIENYESIIHFMLKNYRSGMYRKLYHF